MIPLILGVVKSFRFWAILGALTAVIAFATWAYNQVYQSGYNAARVEHQDAVRVALEQAEARHTQRLEQAVAAAEAEIIIEERIIERIREVEREIPIVIETSVAAECRDLGPDIQRLFNDAINSGSGEGQDSPDAGDSDTDLF